MFAYNCQASGDPFGFLNKSSSLIKLQNIRQRVVGVSTSLKQTKKCLKKSKKKLTSKNVKFLQLLGLKVKNQ